MDIGEPKRIFEEPEPEPLVLPEPAPERELEPV